MKGDSSACLTLRGLPQLVRAGNRILQFPADARKRNGNRAMYLKPYEEIVKQNDDTGLHPQTLPSGSKG